MFSRHELVWLNAAGWAHAGAQAGDATAAAAIAQWQQHDWPAVVRRREPGMAKDDVALGLPLPPAAGGGKGRVGVCVSAAAIARSRQPLLLAEIDDAPPAWRAPIGALLRDAGAGAGVDANAGMLRVFGSLALQALTGQSYVRESSDIDLLVAPADQAALSMASALLQRHAAVLPLDGEIIFPGGAAVAWKEWATPAERLLVKSLDGVRLLPRAALLAMLPG